MEIAMIGLGKMGMNMAKRLLRGGHTVVAYNKTPEKTGEAVREGAIGVFSIDELAAKLSQPRIVWLMLPAGGAVDEYVDGFSSLLSEGDIVIDGGNTYYKDDLRRAEKLGSKGIHFLDVGVSGGIWGLTEGYCLMAGGDFDVYKRVEPLLATLAQPEGYLYCGSAGCGHYVKMVHNGIEYAMMQAYAEGFEILNASPYGKVLDFPKLSHLWNRGSVIRSWLLELLENAFEKDPGLSGIRGYVEDSGEGSWTVREAIELNVPAETITQSLYKRFRSRQEEPFGDKILAALRNEFGGHRVIKKESAGSEK